MQKRKCTPAAALTRCNCLALRQAARQVTQLYDRYLAQDGLRTSQYSILAILSRLGPLSINELATLMVMDRTTTGRAVRPLARDRFVTIKAGSDGRTRVVQLTSAGEQCVSAASVHWREAQKQFESAYGVMEAGRLRSVLAAVVAAA